MINSTLEDVLREHLNFKTMTNGWNMLFCDVCGDGEFRKVARGGWRFEGSFAAYHCFNCGIKANFDHTREYPYCREMRAVLDAFNIPKHEHEAIAYQNVLTGSKAVIPEKKKYALDILPIPDYFYKLSDAKDDNLIAIKSRDYLITRKIDPTSYPFYLSTGITKSDDPREEAIAKSLTNRIIIPAFKGNDMIYYQARSLDEKSLKKYINPNIPKTNIIYGYDKLYQNTDSPLYVTEGFFDSHHINGVAVMGNELSSTQIDYLARSPRKKIIIPDKKLRRSKNDDGKKLVNQAIDLGWTIGLPDIGECVDISKAVERYGKLYVINSINENIYSGFQAKIMMDIW